MLLIRLLTNYRAVRRVNVATEMGIDTSGLFVFLPTLYNSIPLTIAFTTLLTYVSYKCGPFYKIASFCKTLDNETCSIVHHVQFPSVIEIRPIM